MSNRSIAVIGSPGAGSTSTATEMALRLAQRDHRTVLLVFCDPFLPAKGYLCGKNTAQSIGGHLSQASALTEEDLYRAVFPISDWLGVMGYNTGEHSNAYPTPSKGSIGRWYSTVMQIADVVIFDVGSHVEAVLGRELMALATNTLTVVDATTKSAAWYRHIGKNLRSDTLIFNNVRKGQPVDVFSDFTASESFTLPFSEDLQSKLQSFGIFQMPTDRHYNAALEKICGRLTEGA